MSKALFNPSGAAGSNAFIMAPWLGRARLSFSKDKVLAVIGEGFPIPMPTVIHRGRRGCRTSTTGVGDPKPPLRTFAHSTWSHTEDHSRFRIVLPLAELVSAADWPKVWQWAETRAGYAIDPALKNPGSHYALAAMPNPNWPRFAFALPGALLSPAEEGVVVSQSVKSLHPMRPTDGSPSIIRGEDPTRYYLDVNDERSVYFVDEHWEVGTDDLPSNSDDEFGGLLRVARTGCSHEP